MEINLRKWNMEDAEIMVKYANNPKIAENLRDAFPYPYTLADAHEYIYAMQNAPEEERYVRAITVGGEVVGSIGVFREQDVYRRSAEVGYWVAEPFWGKGILTEALKQVCAHTFAHTDIVRIFASVFARNEASCRVLEKAGFALEGTLRSSVWKSGVLMDSKMYSLVKE